MPVTVKEFNQELLKRFLIEMQKRDRGGIYALTQRMMAFNSNKIEGSTLSEEQTANLFDTGSVWGDEVFRAKDIEEANGHFLMFNHMIKTAYSPLSEELIKEYHYYLKHGVFEDLANGYPVGEYKNRKNMVSNIKTALPEEVPDAMMKLLKEYNSKPSHTVEDLAKFHADFERIHPFQDGNGRTGRIILFKECIKNEVAPFIIRDENKSSYYSGLGQVEKNGSYSALSEYFKAEQEFFVPLARDFIFPHISHNKERGVELER